MVLVVLSVTIGDGAISAYTVTTAGSGYTFDTFETFDIVDIPKHIVVQDQDQI